MIAAAAGPFDTRGVELDCLASRLRAAGLEVRTVDLATSVAATQADVPATEVAACHPRGAAAMLGGKNCGAALAARREIA